VRPSRLARDDVTGQYPTSLTDHDGSANVRTLSLLAAGG